MWFPKMTGRFMNETLGKWSFWIMFVGFNIGFFPMHIVGLEGMPRRIYTYPVDAGWGTMNLIITHGAYIFAVGVLLFLINMVMSRLRGKPAGANPWGGGTLEWSVSSPPPPYNFALIPIVARRHPLWEDELQEGQDRSSTNARGFLLNHGRETLGTTTLDAEPDVILKMPGDTSMPLLLSLALTALCTGLLLKLWILFGIGVAVSLLASIVWLWPLRSLSQVER
jgi:cytochrome c oxidase subunit 1/cytochrome c oxidase subunit I+III